MKLLGYLSALALAVCGFLPWVTIESKLLTFAGVDAGPVFGKPAYFHFLMVFLFVVFQSVPRIWARRANLIVVSLNIAWAVRNYFLISACSMGECPKKQVPLYLVLVFSILMLVAALFTGVKMRKNTGAAQR